jgi:hypothetical protein
MCVGLFNNNGTLTMLKTQPMLLIISSTDTHRQTIKRVIMRTISNIHKLQQRRQLPPLHQRPMQLPPIRTHNGINSNSMARITTSNTHKVIHNLSSNILSILLLLMKQMLTLLIINIIHLPLHHNRKSDVKPTVTFRDKISLLTGVHICFRILIVQTMLHHHSLVPIQWAMIHPYLQHLGGRKHSSINLQMVPVYLVSVPTSHLLYSNES